MSHLEPYEPSGAKLGATSLEPLPYNLKPWTKCVPSQSVVEWAEPKCYKVSQTKLLQNVSSQELFWFFILYTFVNDI